MSTWCLTSRSGTHTSAVRRPRLDLLPSRAAAGAIEDIPEDERARRVGTAYCDSWFAGADPELIRLVLEEASHIPKEIDAPMLRAAEREFGSLRAREQVRRIVRQGFLERLSALSEQQPP